MNKKLLTLLLSIVVVIEIALFIFLMPPSTVTETTFNPIDVQTENRFSGTETTEKENPELTRHNTIYLTIIGATIVLGAIGITVVPKNVPGDSD